LTNDSDAEAVVCSAQKRRHVKKSKRLVRDRAGRQTSAYVALFMTKFRGLDLDGDGGRIQSSGKLNAFFLMLGSSE
jgi:hypothetical protein